MKTSIIVILFLLCSQVLSQIDNRDKVNHKNFLKERISHVSNPFEQITHRFDLVNFQNRESKGIINKTILDNKFLLIEYLHQDWDGSSWENYWKNTYTYDGNNYMIEELYEKWSNSSWVNGSKYTYTYDGDNNLIKRLWLSWNDSYWDNFFNSIYTYNGNYYLIEEIFQFWDDFSWIDYWKWTYTYDGNNNMIERLWQDWENAEWVNFLKIAYSYNGNNNMIEELKMRWEDSDWVNSEKNTYTYDGNNNKIEELDQDWDGSNWVDRWKATYTYDGNNNMVEEFVPGDGSMMFKNLFTYDGDNNLIEGLYTFWDGSSWANDEKSTYTYFPITGIGLDKNENLPVQFSLSQNYPNPFNPSTTIKYEIPQDMKRETREVRLMVYDLLGREVATLVNEEQQSGYYEVKFNSNYLSSGVFYYQLRSGSFVETKKMIHLR